MPMTISSNFAAERFATGAIDELDFVDGLPDLVRHRARAVVPAGAPLRLRGWAMDLLQKRPVAAVGVALGDTFTRVARHEERPDIANAFHADEAAFGFTVGVPTLELPPGRYLAYVVAGSEGEATWQQIAEQVVYSAASFERDAGRVEERTLAPIAGNLDAVIDQDRGTVAVGNSLTVTELSGLVVTGWAFHPTDRILETRATILGQGTVRGRHGIERQDIAAKFGRPEAGSAGFSIPLRLDDIPVGEHTLAVEARTKHGWHRIEQMTHVNVLPIDEKFPPGARCLARALDAEFTCATTSFEANLPLDFRILIHDPQTEAIYLEIVDVERTKHFYEGPLRLPLTALTSAAPGTRAYSVGPTSLNLPRGRYVASALAVTSDRRAYRRSRESSAFEVVSARTCRR